MQPEHPPLWAGENPQGETNMGAPQESTTSRHRRPRPSIVRDALAALALSIAVGFGASLGLGALVLLLAGSASAATQAARHHDAASHGGAHRPGPGAARAASATPARRPGMSEAQANRAPRTGSAAAPTERGCRSCRVSTRAPRTTPCTLPHHPASPAGKRYRYRVSDSFIFNALESRIVIDTPLPRLTLVTCYPFDAIAPGGPPRYGVSAERLAM